MALNLEVEILGEFRSLAKATKGSEAALKGLTRSAQSFSRKMNSAFAIVGVGFSLNAVRQEVSKTISAFSDLEQAVGATESVFGDFADVITAESEKAGKAFGLSAREYRQSANLFGAQLKNLGFSLEETTDLTTDLVETGADLAATFGGTTYDAVRALNGVLRGEFDTIERYGVSIKKSDINARLAAQGLDGLTGEALRNAEAMAALDLITEQTADSQGQFARETDTFAGAMQILRAELENTRAELGETFAPVLATFAVQITNQVLPAVERLADAINIRLKGAFQDSGNAAVVFAGQLSAGIDALTELVSGKVSKDNPLLPLVDGFNVLKDTIRIVVAFLKPFAALLDGLIEGLFGWLSILPGVNQEVNGLGSFLSVLADAIEATSQKLTGVFKILGFIGSFFVSFVGGIAKVLTFLGKIGGLFGKFSRVGQALQAAAGFFLKFFSGSKSAVDGVISAITSLNKPFVKIADTLIDLLSRMGDIAVKLKSIGSVFFKPFDFALRILTKVIEVIIDIIGKIGDVIQKVTILRKPLEFIYDLFNNVATAVRDIYNILTFWDNNEVEVDIKVNVKGLETKAIEEGLIGDVKRQLAKDLALGASPTAAKAQKDKDTTGTDTATKSVKKFLDIIKKLQDKLKELRKGIEDVRKALIDGAKALSDQFVDAANLSFGIIERGLGFAFRPERLQRQFQRVLSQVKDFQANIQRIREQGGSQSLLDQIIGLGPVQGAVFARGLATAGSSLIQDFQQSQETLAAYGASLFGETSAAIEGRNEMKRLTEALSLNTKALNGTRNASNRNLTVNINAKMSAKEIIAEIKAYERQYGRVFS